MKIASHHSQVCLDVFINCKNLLTGLGKEAVSLPSPVAKLLNECAQISMGTFFAIKNHSVNASQLALLCMGICEECAEVCDCFDNSIFKQCAQTCRYCSNSISELARLN
jgi:hypothetical protein